MITPTRGVGALRRVADQDRNDDAVEVALAAAGDAHAFERLYRGHANRVHSLARRMLSEDEADEATQDVFVRCWQKLHTFRGESAFGTWLHRLAINVCLGRRATHGKRRARFTATDDVLALVPHRVERHSDSALDLEEAISRLPDGARQVFVLHDVEGYRHEEIAQMLGTVVGTSKSQLHRARMALRRHLRPST